MSLPVPCRERVVITDASFLANLIRIDHPRLLEALSDRDLVFVAPDQVIEEVAGGDDRRSDDAYDGCDLDLDDLHDSLEHGRADSLERALREGSVRLAGRMDPRELPTYDRYRSTLGRGEAACLAIAESRGWIVGSDESGAFRRRVRERLGEDRHMETPEVLLLAIRRGLLSIDDADALGAKLEHRGLGIPFASSRGMLGTPVTDALERKGADISIVVDANEATCGLAKVLAMTWPDVEVKRLPAGDVAIGDRVLVERKTAQDYIASLADGRLFDQAYRLIGAVARPLLILEGDLAGASGRVHPGCLRGAQLAIAVGYRIPVLTTGDLAETVACLCHIASQEARRKSRRQSAPRAGTGHRRGVDHEAAAGSAPRSRLPPEAFDLLLALPGVGKERARAIAENVGSLDELCRLGVRGLLSVPGVGPDTAARIVDAMRGLSAEAGASSSRHRASR